MPEPDPQRAKDIFMDAQDRPVPERRAFVEAACAGDPELCAEVLALLEAHTAAGDFLESPPTWALDAAASRGEEREAVGQRIGPFCLEERIGEGGFGTVWRAQQDGPVRRQVALKIVKLGMDTVDVVRRFEQERSALARMDHPNVAKVFDGGVTEDGRPWFAMEFVAGDPIHLYCDRQRLDTRQRVRLLIDVCLAVQHAHHKGIVHRDIKPSNVLVSHGDRAALPRVIDFGIAKAMEGEGFGQTMVTAQGGLLGTPEYMSPEQVQAGSDVDARTDVYSLGALIYEVLTGARPFNFASPSGDRLEVLLRRIREEDPARPSTLVGGLDELATKELMAARRSTPRDLRRLLRGDLDWITLRAMEKDPRRRYATADQLASDLSRYLRDEPVLAGPPSLLYRLHKLSRRHRGALLFAGLALASLLAGASFAWYGLFQARAAERSERLAREQAVQRAEDAKAEALRARLALGKLEELLFSADPRAAHAADYSARQMLLDFAGRLAAAPLADRLVEARIHHSLGLTFMQLAAHKESDRHLRAALAIRARLLGPTHLEFLRSRKAIAMLRSDQSRHKEALQILDEVIAGLQRQRGNRRGDLEYAAARESQAGILLADGQLRQGLAAAEEALAICERLVGAEHLDTARCRGTRARLRLLLGEREGLEAVFKQVGAVLAAHLPDHHPDVTSNAQSLGVFYDRGGRRKLALQQYRRSLAGRIKVHGEHHPLVANTRMSIGWALLVEGDLAAADTELGRAVAAFAEIVAADHPALARAQLRHGECLSRRGRHAAALVLLRAAVQTLVPDAGPVGESALSAQSNLCLALQRAGQKEAGIRAGRRFAALLPRARELPDSYLVHAETNCGRALFRLGENRLALTLLESAAARAARLWAEGHQLRRIVEGFLAEARKRAGR